MNSKTTTIGLLLFTLLFFTGCSKEEGYGGNSRISGTLVEHVYNDDYSQLIYQKKGIEEDVYIIFEDKGVISDKVSTGLDGQFEFKDLFPGNYKIYYYSEDKTSAYRDDIEVIIDVKLEKNTTLDLGELILNKSIEYDKGSASIKGKVFLINYYNSSVYPNLIVKDTSLALDQEVYIIYGNHATYEDRIRTNYDGTFYFGNLIKGDYKVFLYSEDVSGKTQDIVIMKEATISSEFDKIDLGNIYIEKL